MSKPELHGPYSVEELSNMDDTELGRLYREKNGPEIEQLEKSNEHMAIIMSVLIGWPLSLIAIIFVGSIPGFFGVLLTVIAVGSTWIPLRLWLKKRIRQKRGWDAFDNLYPHEIESRIFDYVLKEHDYTENISHWTGMLKTVSSNTSGYTDAELGELLKIVIPVLAYIKESGYIMNDRSFGILDEEFALNERMKDFLNNTYTEMIRRSERERNDNVRQCVTNIKDRNRHYADGLAELEKSADYRKMMDLKRTLDEKKRILSEQVKMENVG